LSFIFININLINQNKYIILTKKYAISAHICNKKQYLSINKLFIKEIKYIFVSIITKLNYSMIDLSAKEAQSLEIIKRLNKKVDGVHYSIYLEDLQRNTNFNSHNVAGIIGSLEKKNLLYKKKCSDCDVQMTDYGMSIIDRI